VDINGNNFFTDFQAARANEFASVAAGQASTRFIIAAIPACLRFKRSSAERSEFRS